MTEGPLRFSVENHVARITLNRPEAANSLNLDLARSLFDAAVTCDEDSDIRAVVLTGAGKMFCAGGDLKSFWKQEADLGRHLKEVTTWLHAAISRLARMNEPLVAAVNGTAAGAGMSLACCCDMALAAESARFTMAYTKVGLTPDGSSTYFLPRIIGRTRALELTLTNRILSAREAEAWGLVTRVVPDAELLAEATVLATTLASGATGAFGVAKRLLHWGWTETLETQMENESRALAGQAETPDGREGISAFLEKRSPSFTGR